MIFLSSICFFRVAVFLIHMFPAAAESPGDFCERDIYGQPSYSACVALLYGGSGRRSGGIFRIDDDDHGFLLPFFGARGRFTINQWRHRVHLPEVWHNGTPRSLNHRQANST